MALFKNRSAYENLTRWIFDGVGEYGIPEVKLPDNMNTTTTYDKWLSRHRKKFDDWYFGGK